MLVNEAQHQFIIGGRNQTQVKAAELVVAGFFRKKGRMRRHPPLPEHTVLVITRLPFPENKVRIVFINVIEIGIGCIRTGSFNDLYHFFDHLPIGVKVVAVQNTDQLAAGHSNAFVQGIVKTLIFFRYKFGDPVAVRFYDCQGTIRRAAIYNNVFDVDMGLRQHRLQRAFECGRAIVGNGYDRYFQSLSGG